MVCGWVNVVPPLWSGGTTLILMSFHRFRTAQICRCDCECEDQSGGSTSACANISGEGDPTGIVTPTCVNQLYRDEINNALYQATALNSGAWLRWIVWLALLPTAVFGQGVSVRSLDGSATNLAVRGLSMPVGAIVNYVWTVTNATTGAGTWRPQVSGLTAGVTNQWKIDATNAALAFATNTPGITLAQVRAVVQTNAVSKTSNYIQQPFDVSRTVISIVGDSHNRGYNNDGWAEVITNRAWWIGLKAFTNSAVGGTPTTGTGNGTTNIIYTRTIPWAYTNLSPGDTWICWIGAGVIDYISGILSSTELIYSNVYLDLHRHATSNRWNLVISRPTLVTPLHNSELAATLPNVAPIWIHNNLLARSPLTNLIYCVPDIARVFPNNWDTNYWYTTNGIPDYTHIADDKTELYASIVDETWRGLRPKFPNLFTMEKDGQGWDFRDEVTGEISQRLWGSRRTNWNAVAGTWSQGRFSEDGTFDGPIGSGAGAVATGRPASGAAGFEIQVRTNSTTGLGLSVATANQSPTISIFANGAIDATGDAAVKASRFTHLRIKSGGELQFTNSTGMEFVWNLANDGRLSLQNETNSYSEKFSIDRNNRVYTPGDFSSRTGYNRTNIFYNNATLGGWGPTEDMVLADGTNTVLTLATAVGKHGKGITFININSWAWQEVRPFDSSQKIGGRTNFVLHPWQSVTLRATNSTSTLAGWFVESSHTISREGLGDALILVNTNGLGFSSLFVETNSGAATLHVRGSPETLTVTAAQIALWNAGGNTNAFSVSSNGVVIAGSATNLNIINGNVTNVNGNVSFGFTGASLADADYGDISVSGGGTVMTVDSVSSFNKIGGAAPTTIIGRFSGGVGTLEGISLSSDFGIVGGVFTWTGATGGGTTGMRTNQFTTNDVFAPVLGLLHYSGVSGWTNGASNTGVTNNPNGDVSLSHDLRVGNDATITGSLNVDGVTAQGTVFSADGFSGNNYVATNTTQGFIGEAGSLTNVNLTNSIGTIPASRVTGLTGGGDMLKANNLSDLANVDTGRITLGAIGTNDTRNITPSGYWRHAGVSAWTNGAAGIGVTNNPNGTITASSSISSPTFVGALTGNATTATTATLVADADKGDISISSGVWSIDNDVVTYAKIQNVTDARLLGRSAGSSGDVQEITVGTGLSLSGGSLTAIGGSSGPFTNTYIAYGDLYQTNAMFINTNGVIVSNLFGSVTLMDGSGYSIFSNGVRTATGLFDTANVQRLQFGASTKLNNDNGATAFEAQSSGLGETTISSGDHDSQMVFDNSGNITVVAGTIVGYARTAANNAMTGNNIFSGNDTNAGSFRLSGGYRISESSNICSIIWTNPAAFLLTNRACTAAEFGSPVAGSRTTLTITNSELTNWVLTLPRNMFSDAQNQWVSTLTVYGSARMKFEFWHDGGTNYVGQLSGPNAPPLSSAATNNLGGTSFSNLVMVTSDWIPFGGWWTNGMGPAPYTSASAVIPTNTADAFEFTDGVTNTIRTRWHPPWDWNAGTVQVQLLSMSRFTNDTGGNTKVTNSVFSTRMAAVPNGGTEDNLTFGTGVWTTNKFWFANTNLVTLTNISTAITVGNTPTSGKDIVIEISRLGAATGDTTTNLVALYGGVVVFYQRNSRIDFPVATP